MEKSGPRLTANRKQQKALLLLLRQLRTEAGLRQIDMAKALGKPQAFVSYYESGARRLDLLELRQICGILGISLVDLIKRLEKLVRFVDQGSCVTFIVLGVRFGFGCEQHNFHQLNHRSEEHTSELQSPCNLVCRLLLE